jgi:hypothetical protein
MSNWPEAETERVERAFPSERQHEYSFHPNSKTVDTIRVAFAWATARYGNCPALWTFFGVGAKQTDAAWYRAVCGQGLRPFAVTRELEAVPFISESHVAFTKGNGYFL